MESVLAVLMIIVTLSLAAGASITQVVIGLVVVEAAFLFRDWLDWRKGDR